jgi:predicted Zn-ribbon and HTH transcriptional regulator
LQPKAPAPREETIRQQLLHELARGPITAYELSGRLRISERDVEGHLEHLSRSLKRQGERSVVVTPAQCLSCDFKFTQRTRFSRPGRCPQCRGTHLEAPLFQVLPT